MQNCKVFKVLRVVKDVIKNYNKVRTYTRAYLIEKRGLTSEVIKADIGIVHTEGVEEIQYRLGHHRRTAEVVLDVLGSVMLLEVGVAHNRSDEARGVLDTQLVGLRVRTIQREVEMEVRELLDAPPPGS